MLMPLEVPVQETLLTAPSVIVSRSVALDDPSSARAALIDPAGAFLLIDKPYGYTSFSVVNQIRRRITRATGIKRVKVGHAGTLDPLATGLLILATRRCTKSISVLSNMDKVYCVRMRLGVTSPSHDLETKIEISGDPIALDRTTIAETVQKLEISESQVPPIFSAIKQQGKAVYHKARAGQAVTMESRPVTFHSISIVSVELPFVTLTVHCGKGTYIRSLVHDIGELLGVGAVMTDLERTSVGEFNNHEALTYDEAIALLETNAAETSW